MNAFRGRNQIAVSQRTSLRCFTAKATVRCGTASIGSAVAAWFGDDLPYSIKMDLRRFKQVMETGEVITTEGQPAGRADSVSWKYDVASRQ